MQRAADQRDSKKKDTMDSKIVTRSYIFQNRRFLDITVISQLIADGNIQKPPHFLQNINPMKWKHTHKQKETYKGLK